uniref:Uncharacterized protein n=1 Tax=Ananas comosus var. bracteatus TaxID=296719 RepID=A0A6V7P4I6_ANACO|nr:unnamed protein product [Ananas comosus var. bracteatus]
MIKTNRQWHSCNYPRHPGPFSTAPSRPCPSTGPTPSMARSSKLSKLKGALKRWNSTPVRAVSRSVSGGPAAAAAAASASASARCHHHEDEAWLNPRSDDEDRLPVPSGLHPVFVGKSRRRYLLSSDLVSHPSSATSSPAPPSPATSPATAWSSAARSSSSSTSSGCSRTPIPPRTRSTSSSTSTPADHQSLRALISKHGDRPVGRRRCTFSELHMGLRKTKKKKKKKEKEKEKKKSRSRIY